MVRIDIGSSEEEGYYAIEFRQNPITNEIRGYRFINAQWEELNYPLKPLNGVRIDSLSEIESLIQQKLEPIISKKGEIKWIIPPNLPDKELWIRSYGESTGFPSCSGADSFASTSTDLTPSTSLDTLAPPTNCC